MAEFDFRDMDMHEAAPAKVPPPPRKPGWFWPAVIGGACVAIAVVNWNRPAQWQVVTDDIPIQTPVAVRRPQEAKTGREFARWYFRELDHLAASINAIIGKERKQVLQESLDSMKEHRISWQVPMAYFDEKGTVTLDQFGYFHGQETLHSSFFKRLRDLHGDHGEWAGTLYLVKLEPQVFDMRKHISRLRQMRAGDPVTVSGVIERLTDEYPIGASSQRVLTVHLHYSGIKVTP